MFGGVLLNSNICPLPKHNVLFAVYSNRLYIFSLEQTHLINDIELSEHLIIHFLFQQTTNSILAIDADGNIITATFNQADLTKCDKVSKHKICKQILDCRIVVDESKKDGKQFSVFYLSNNSLNQYHKGTGAKNVISKGVHKILYSSKDYIVCSINEQSTEISIFSLYSQSAKLLKSYKHPVPITSIEIAQNLLIIGDYKGKIHLIKQFLSSNYQNIKTTYEWHLHQVLGLYCVGQYLYSSGEEGTVVMWHLRQNKRDFLPRIGTQINRILVQSGTVYTLLADNRINSVDLSNDKRVRNYCTIINPFGFITKQIHQDQIKGLTNYQDKALIFQPIAKANKIVISSLPGSLQILDLATGINQKLEIIERNLVGRLDDQYPQPHQIIEAKFSKNGDILACSVIGVNCNVLRFYKYQNFAFRLISKIQNPHKGGTNQTYSENFKIVSYKSMFLTYSQNDPIIRFWAIQSYKKKSIIQREQQIMGCCGELSFRTKNPIYVTSCQQDDIVGVVYQNQVALISLKDKKIQSVYKTKQLINKVEIIRSGAKTFLVMLSKTRLIKYQLTNNQMVNSRKITEFTEDFQEFTLIHSLFNPKSKKVSLAVLIKGKQSQRLIEFDLQTSKITNELINQSSDAKLNNICYINNKLLALSSKFGLYNLTDDKVPVTYKKKSEVSFKFDVEQTNYQEQSLNSLHENYVARHYHKMKSQIVEIDEKIQVQMYPSLQVGFKILMEKILY